MVTDGRMFAIGLRWLAHSDARSGGLNLEGSRIALIIFSRRTEGDGRRLSTRRG